MTDAIAHRGPDGEGHWINHSSTIGLGHRRLSIIDLSDNAAQPMLSADGRYCIVFNGEIYNYIELRDNLVKNGHQFKTQSDTEVLLKLFELKQEDCLGELDGMFAFAVWDEMEKKLFCARDRFGEKPFFYHYEPGRSFTFASEMKAIFAAGVEKNINQEMLFNFLNCPSYITDPIDRTKTFYNSISKLPPAHFLKISDKLQLETKRYWSLDDKNPILNINYKTAGETFIELFYESIKRRLRSDVPVGSSLSGGLDSSSIVCVIDDLNKDRHIKQNTFSARFKNFHRDEGFFIEKVIEKTGVIPHYTWPDEDGFINDLAKLCYYQEEPFPSASIYAQYCVMEKAKEENVTVLLDGQGADEILAGYEYYMDFYLAKVFSKDRQAYLKELETFRKVNINRNFMDLANPVQIEAPREKKSLVAAMKNMVRPAYKIINPAKYRRIQEKIPVPGFFTKEFTEQFKQNVHYDFSYTGDDLNGHLKHSVHINNLEDLLRFADRNSMAHSREVRLPFLSHKLVEYIFTLPDSFKLHAGWTKYLLRDSMKSLLPTEITWRIDKIGFEPPQVKWLKNKRLIEQTCDSFEVLKKNKIVHENAALTEDRKWQILMSTYLFKQ